MTLSVFLRNPAKCRGPERSASGLRAGALPSAHPAGAAALHPGSKTGSHAFDGMASYFAGLVHGGAFWCQRYRTIRSWRWNCSAYEHQRASATEAVESVVEIVVVGLITSDGRRSCRRGDHVQRLQQIAKLNRGNRQLLPDDGTNCFPQAFIGGRLAVIGIDSRNDQRAVGHAAPCVKLTQQRSGLRTGWTARCRRGSGYSDSGC